MKYAFYYSKKNGRVAFYSKEDKNIVDKNIFDVIEINLSAQEEDTLKKNCEKTIKDKKLELIEKL